VARPGFAARIPDAKHASWPAPLRRDVGLLETDEWNDVVDAD
jgi:hypothetical protein